jgi:hypothetical protein
MNNDRFATLRRWFLPMLCLALAVPATPALAERNFSAWRPGSAKKATAAVLQLAPAADPGVRVGPIDRAEIAAMRAENAVAGLRALKLGVVRAVSGEPGTGPASLAWHAGPGGHAAQWHVTADEARAVRVRLAVRGAPAGVVARFAAASPASPVSETRIPARGEVWSPVLEGDGAIVELFAPSTVDVAQVSIALAAVAPYFVDPAQAGAARTLAKSAGAATCEVEVACVASADEALARAASAVALVTYSSEGYTWACTGTLLNPGDGSFAPYFYTAAHCIHDAQAAASVTTFWFAQARSCGSDNAAPVQLGGGARLLVADTTLDGALLRLNEMPPESALYAGWDSLPTQPAASITTIHHPGGGLKKVSEGIAGAYQDQRFVAATWTLGITEPGSSGAGLFTAVQSPHADYLVRGTLVGGNSMCMGATPAGTDVYSRFDLMWPQLAPYLSARAPGANRTGLWWDPAEPGWAVDVEHQEGVVIATLFGYGADGAARWYIASALREQADGDFQGDLFEASGPAFDTSPWTRTTMRTVGTMRIVFAGSGAARLSFTIDGASFAKDIVPMVFGASGRAVCSFVESDRTHATNYQDLWWNPSESGWGLAVAHQGDALFGVLFTYGDDGAPAWFAASDVRLQPDGSYAGTLYRAKGSPFAASSWQPASSVAAGTLALRFGDGDSATLSYSIDGRAVSKPITRLVVTPSVPGCK